MTPIPWTTLEGGQCETLVSVMLLREYPDGVRIRPSQGDGGIDVLVPVPGNRNLVDIYQIKRFAQNLTSSQKRQIKRSIIRIRETIESDDLKVRNWHLTMPLDPTSQNLTWLKDQFNDPNVGVSWKGLTFIEGLVSKYPEVVDYYLNNGLGRFEAQLDRVLQMGQLLRDSENSGLALGVEAVQAAGVTLVNHLNSMDPHYKYDIYVTNEMPESVERYVVPRTMLIQTAGKPGGPYITLVVIAHYNEAPIDRPLRVDARIIHGGDPEILRQLDDFHSFGGRLSMGPENAQVQVTGNPLQPDGTGYTPGTVELTGWSFPEEVGRVFRIVARTPSGTEATLIVSVTERTAGPTREGLRTRFRSKSGGTVFQIEVRYDPEGNPHSGKLSLGYEWDGKVAVELLDDAAFWECHEPGVRFLIGPQYGGRLEEFAYGSDDLESPMAPKFLTYVRALAALQPYADSALIVPERVGSTEWTSTCNLASLLEGEAIHFPTSALKAATDSADTAEQLAAEVQQNNFLALPGPPFVAVAAGVRVEIPNAQYTVENITASINEDEPGIVTVHPREGDHFFLTVSLAE